MLEVELWGSYRTCRLWFRNQESGVYTAPLVTIYFLEWVILSFIYMGKCWNDLATALRWFEQISA